VLVFILTIILSWLTLGDLEVSDSRLRLSEHVGNRLMLYLVQPKCPHGFCSQCQNAQVMLTLVVGKSGMVKQIMVGRTPDPKLAEATIDAVKQWRYERYFAKWQSRGIRNAHHVEVVEMCNLIVLLWAIPPEFLVKTPVYAS